MIKSSRKFKPWGTISGQVRWRQNRQVNGAPEGDSGTFRFTGTIRRVTVDLSGDLIQDSEADMKIAMARQ
jgi:hypothetical protein